MNNLSFMKNYKKPWYWMVAIATLLGIATLVLYLVNGTTRLDPNYSFGVIIGLAVGIAVGVMNLIITFNACMYVQYLGFFYAFCSYLTANVNLYGSIAYGVDGQSVPANFIFVVILTTIIFVVSLIAAIMMPREKRKGDELKND